MKITVIGGGNIGTLMAAEMAAKGHAVTMFTSKPQKWNKQLQVYDAAEKLLLTGCLTAVTSDLQEAVQDAEMIFVTMPAETFSDLAKRLLPVVHAGQYIGIVPGSGGVELVMHALIEKGCVLFGLQRVHSIARLKQYGSAVYMLGRKSELHTASIPQRYAADIAQKLESMFDMPCHVLKNYLAVTLTPSNPILHTSRLYAMFHDYAPDVFYPKNILFYEEWDDTSSEVLFQCDAELQELCRVLPFPLDEVVSLKKHYESDTVPAMTHKIRSIPAFHGLTSPMCQTEQGWIPDLTSRYFVSDFAYGLKVIRDIMQLFAVDCPMISTVWNWYQALDAGQHDTFELTLNQEKFLRIYRL